ncbi:unnamed protein product [Rhizoctonia solani]|uniref:Nitrogen permease regulator n=1 Tax=Rhizoctonia solani TaxID=456999 RepID=A0A8H3H4F6_9AGAM|nr:Nitrogen permease regulator [Rhizoctonia solani]CAE6479796.1 unnamed protein product [Rhizoctonia solani]
MNHPEPPNMNESFLPRIQSIFYAVFDPVKGPQIVCQVPEDGITIHQPHPASGVLSPTLNPVTSRSPSGSPFKSPPHLPLTLPVETSTPNYIPPAQSQPQALPPTASRSSSQSRIVHNNSLLDFDSISEYVIPKDELCGRLLQCNTPRHRILGFPVALKNDVYRRLWFRYNLCFVFDREADLSCYEPIVRKCGRVLMACERETNFLSKSATSHQIHSIIEQLYGDLNSYSETSIQIDECNFFELRVFPFYPNPAPVQDWDVPVALINIEKRMDENWDLTIARVVRFVDGANHVKRICELADVDLELGRLAVQHLLFYQCVIMVDIFQYSNIYALKPSIEWLANDPGVQEECPGYVTLPGHTPPSWPELLRLYSRLSHSQTVHSWLESASSVTTSRSNPTTPKSPMGISPDIVSSIDPRRFISFGVIKGFVRRVRRWPVLLSRRGKRGPGRILSGDQVEGIRSAFQERSSHNSHGDEGASVGTIRAGSGGSGGMLSASMGTLSASLSPPTTRPSASALLRSVAAASGVTESATATNSGVTTALSTSPLAPRAPRTTPTQQNQIARARPDRSDSISTVVYHPPPPSPNHEVIPPELEALLDGTHHADELCVKFGVSWQILERWLSLLGGGNGTPEDMGRRVMIIYR